MSDLAVTPVRTNDGFNSGDVGLTAGAAAVGALGGGAMYFKTPSEDAFVKAGLKLGNKEFAEQAETLTAALKEASGLDAGKTLPSETVEAVKKLGVTDPSVDNLKAKLKDTIGRISDQKAFDKAKAAANEAVAGTIDDAVTVAKQADSEAGIKGLYEGAKDNIKKAADQLDDQAKKGVEIFKKAKSSAALKWGGIAAATLAVLTAGYLFFTKDNGEAAEQPAQTEKA